VEGRYPLMEKKRRRQDKEFFEKYPAFFRMMK
jgi:hypothetical protein